MTAAPAKVPEELQEIPDLEDWGALIGRLGGWVSRAQGVVPSQVSSVVALDFAGLGAVGRAGSGPQGLIFEEGFRRWVVAVLVADWATYPLPEDRVDLVRLLLVMQGFPQGFRLWLAHTNDGFVPVGYTGWYPIPEAHLLALDAGQPPPADRLFLPLPELPAENRAVYLFNYGIVPQLKGTPYAQQLMRAYAEDLQRLGPTGLAALVVSPDGQRVAERFGMGRRLSLSRDGAPPEGVFVGRVGLSARPKQS